MPAARSLLVVAALAGCWRARVSDPPALTNSRTDANGDEGWVITPRGVGPFDQGTKASEVALQRLVPNLIVKTHDLGGESGIVYDIFDGREQLFYVVPDDAPGYTESVSPEHTYSSTMFAIFAVSPRVRVLGRSWRVGELFEETADLDECECWGAREVTACLRRGNHVRVIFEETCSEAELEGPKAMIGKRITRIMWKREVEPEVDTFDDAQQQP